MVFQVNEILPCETLQLCLVFFHLICKQNKNFRTIKYCTLNFYNWGNFLLSKWKYIQTTITICLKHAYCYIQKIVWWNLKKLYVNLKTAPCDMLDWLLRIFRSKRIMCFNYSTDPYSYVYGFLLRAKEQLLHTYLQESRTIWIIAWPVIDLLHNISNYRKAVTWAMLEIWPY